MGFDWFKSSSNAGDSDVDRNDPQGFGKAYEATRARLVKEGKILDATPEDRAKAQRILDEGRWW